MPTQQIVVEGCIPTPLDDTNLRDELWSLVLDQRAFGPQKLWVAFADWDGTFRGLAYTDRLEPLEPRFDACLAFLGEGAELAYALCDEAVSDDSSLPELADRLALMRALAAGHNIWLADWICCDDQLFRSVAESVYDTDDSPLEDL